MTILHYGSPGSAPSRTSCGRSGRKTRAIAEVTCRACCVRQFNALSRTLVRLELERAETVVALAAFEKAEQKAV
jgi:hypothetical protein